MERDSDWYWFAKDGGFRSMEIHAGEPLGRLGFDLRSKREREREQKKINRSKGKRK